MSSDGWIKLHRKFLEWEWWDDPKVTRLFLYCLLKANYQDKQWKGQTIPRGTFITSLDQLARGTGLTIQNIRTAMGKLEETGEINKRSTTVNTWVTIVNYDRYQETNKPVTNDQQTTNKRLTTTKNTKNKKNTKNTLSSVCREIAAELLAAIVEDDPGHKYAHNPPKLTGRSWALEIDRALRLDKRTPEQLRFVIDYVFRRSTPVADFWKPNIQSGKKLRAKFDQIKNQIKRELNNDKEISRKRNTNDAIQQLDRLEFDS